MQDWTAVEDPHSIIDDRLLDDDDTVGGRISRAREAMSLTVGELARHLGILDGVVSDWEQDRSEPRTNRLVMLAGFLNVSPTWLLIGKGDEPQSQEAGATVSLDQMRIELNQLRVQYLRMGSALERMEDLVETIIAPQQTDQ